MNGRVALVSGANRGLGLEVARQLAARGFTVVMGGRDEGQAAAAAAEGIEGDVHPHQLDVADQASVDRCVGWIESRFARLDALVNNAGVGSGISAHRADVEATRDTFEVNLFGAWRLAVACVPLMRRAGGGRIVNVSSGMGQLSDMRGGSAPYRISKAGLNALTRILAAELRSEGILVNSVCPGWIQTDMGTAAAPRSVQQGADTPVWLATLPDDGPTGGFYRDREPIPW
jgi:NAD(P)-dependent dehydrogenase (short-subunit alcohol dehydrogenase family)